VIRANAADAGTGSRFGDHARIVAVALGSRALLLLVGALTLASQSEDHRLHVDDLLSVFVRWDAAWYLGIATEGYTTDFPAAHPGATRYAYFPLYPLLIRGAVAITGLGAAPVGVLLSTLLFVLALCLVYEYALAIGMRRDVGLASTVLLAFAPQSFVFSSAYAESTFLVLLAGAMLALQRERYVIAGILAALLSAVRPNGIVFVAYAVAWICRRFGWRALLMPWRAPGPHLVLVLAPLGLVAYWWFAFATTGDAFAQATSIAHGWGWRGDWPWLNLARHVGAPTIDRFWVWGSIAYFVASLWLLRYRLFAEFALCGTGFLLNWISVLPNSLVRYALVYFPIFIALARATSGHAPSQATLAAALALINGMLMVAFTMQWIVSI
jgi:hypothetical protein